MLSADAEHRSAPSGTASTPAPVRGRDRLNTIDVLRGVALLGILLMNIVAMGLPHWAYDNPNVIGNRSPVDFWAWAINSVLFEGKMRTIFSMLFGAGVILLTSRAEARGTGESIADISLRRNLWLVLFGMIHAYLLLWPGDILYMYGLAGVALFAFRHVRPRNLIILGGVLLALQVPKVFFYTQSLNEASAGLANLQRLTAAGTALTEEQKTKQKEWEKALEDVQPKPEAVQKAIEARRKGYFAVMAAQAGVVAVLESTFTYKIGIWDCAGMMLIGMALFKLGVFSASRTYRFYTTLAVCAYGYGIPIGMWVVHDWVRRGFDPGARWAVLYDTTRLAVALGHVAVVMMICKAGLFRPVTTRLAAVGQMALTNYIMHSVITAVIFCGFGFGLFGRLARHELYYVVFSIWAFQLIVSPIWLRYFYFGPLEWGWRSLTYRVRQPMRIRSEIPAAEPVAV